MCERIPAAFHEFRANNATLAKAPRDASLFPTPYASATYTTP